MHTLLLAAALCPTVLGASPLPVETIVSFDTDADIAVVTSHDAILTRESAGLRVTTGHREEWPGITIKAPGGHWDLSKRVEVSFSIENVDSKPVTINCRIDGSDHSGENSLTESVTLKPGEQKHLSVQLARLLPAELSDKLFGMRGLPGGIKPNGIDVARVTQLIVFINKPTQDHAFRLGNIRACGSCPPLRWTRLSSEDFFPMIDRLGQFVHGQWPGKMNGVEEFQDDIQREREELVAKPGPGQWNRFGGWIAGPQLKATGHFYVVKQEGKWWLVDPDGRLFWSHGVNCVGAAGSTPISDREFYFAELPPRGTPLAKFYGRASWAPHGYYKDRGAYRTYNFTGANLRRKYGDDWYGVSADLAHRRLRSWSMNTIANWSDSGVYLRRMTPYVASTSTGDAKRIEGSTGYWGKFPDPFDASFRRELDRRMRWHRDRTAGDPWCIGYFVDNELAWGKELSLAIAALTSPREQAAKKSFLSDLRAKYESIEKLNEAWKTSHASWAAMAESRAAPDERWARGDLEAFYTKLAEQYFRECRDAVKRVAPDNLYLGCRFAWVNDRVARSAAKYCDVMTYNLYRDNVADFVLPEGLDKPVVIGEFHFGALDRGMFHTGLRPTASQEDRADAYRRYVTGALKNRFLVGAHWFQYGDQATTGRGDGENYQIGLVSICDRPYPETIDAVREVGSSMYQVRSREKKRSSGIW